MNKEFFSQISDFLEILNNNGFKNNLVIYKNSGHALDKDPDSTSYAREIFKNYCEAYFNVLTEKRN